MEKIMLEVPLPMWERWKAAYGVYGQSELVPEDVVKLVDAIFRGKYSVVLNDSKL